MIPSYPGSKNLVLAKQVFGRSKATSSTEVNKATKSDSNLSGTALKSGIVPFKGPPSYASVVSTRRDGPSVGVSAHASVKDKGKRHMDGDGITLVTNKRGSNGLARGQFSSGYNNVNIFNALQHAGTQAIPPKSPTSSPLRGGQPRGVHYVKIIYNMCEQEIFK